MANAVVSCDPSDAKLHVGDNLLLRCCSNASKTHARLKFTNGSEITLYNGYILTTDGHTAEYEIYPEEDMKCVKIGKIVTLGDDGNVLFFEDNEPGPSILITVLG